MSSGPQQTIRIVIDAGGESRTVELPVVNGSSLSLGLSLHDVPGAAPPSPLAGLPAFESRLAWAVNGPRKYTTGTGYNPDQSEHYDVIHVFQEAHDYAVLHGLTPSEYADEIDSAVVRLRDRYFLSAGHTTGYHNFPLGVSRHYYDTGSVSSRDSVMLLASDAAMAAWAGSARSGQNTSREVAFSVLAMLERERYGWPHDDKLETLAALAIAHVDEWTAAPGTRAWATYVRPFMVGLTCEALIAYWQRYRADTTTPGVADLVKQIPGKVKQALDWLWDNLWVESDPRWSHGAFRYTDQDTAVTLAPFPAAVHDKAPAKVRFSGPDSLTTQDGFYRYALIRFTSGKLTGQQKYCVGYDGDTRSFLFDAKDCFTSAPADGDTFNITSSTGYNTGGTAVAPDLNLLISHGYAWYYWYTARVLGNADATYRDRHDAVFNGSVVAWQDVDKQKTYNQCYRSSFAGLRYRERGDAEWPAATGFAFKAPEPASGKANALSGLFRVELPPGTSLPGPVEISFASSTGGLGTFFPPTAWLTTERPYASTQWIPDPLSDGQSVTVTASSGGKLSDPAAVVFGVAGVAPIATGYTLAGPASGVVKVPAPFVVALDPPGSVMPLPWLLDGGPVLAVTTNDGYSGGRFSAVDHDEVVVTPDSATAPMWVSGERPEKRFTYSANAATTKRITASNGLGVKTPDPVVYEASP